MKDLFFSVLIPTYNAEKIVGETIKSILSQDYKNFELVIQDDVSKDDTLKVVRDIKDDRIKIYKNKTNLGYPGNIEAGRKNCKGEILFLMGNDDILASGTLKEVNRIFVEHIEVGAVARPYFWFMNDINIPVRAKKQLNSKKNEIVKINSSIEKVIRVVDTLDQFSGLAFRVKFMDQGFHPDIFPCHIYPFMSVIKKHPIVFMKNYTIAVRITSSQTRYLSSIYEKSPLLSWVEMIRNIFPEKKFANVADGLIEGFIARNYVGLVQIRNYSTYKNLLREIGYLVKFRPQNLYSPAFWFFSLGTMILPPVILIPLVDWYKNKIYAKSFTNIKFSYSLNAKSN